VPLLGLLRETVASNDDALKVLQRERGYFSANALRMQYPLFRQQGLPVAGGQWRGRTRRQAPRPATHEAGRHVLE
jgi:hypothetical protein